MVKKFDSETSVNVEGVTITFHYTIVEHPVVWLRGVIEEPAYYEFDYMIVLDPVPTTATAATAVQHMIQPDDKVWKICFNHWKNQENPRYERT